MWSGGLVGGRGEKKALELREVGAVDVQPDYVYLWGGAWVQSYLVSRLLD